MSSADASVIPQLRLISGLPGGLVTDLNVTNDLNTPQMTDLKELGGRSSGFNQISLQFDGFAEVSLRGLVG